MYNFILTSRFLLHVCVSIIASFRLASHTFWCFQDNWIAHQDDFNQLLAALNTCHGQETAGKDISTTCCSSHQSHTPAVGPSDLSC